MPRVTCPTRRISISPATTRRRPRRSQKPTGLASSIPSNMTLNVALVLPRGQRSDGAAAGQLGDAPDDAAATRGQRHAVVDLWRRSRRLCRRAGGAHGARHSAPGQCRRQRRLHQLGGIADDLGAADAASFHGPVRQDALWRRSLPPVLEVICRCPTRSGDRIWFDSQPLWGTYPGTPNDLSGGAAVHPPNGPLSIGNALLATFNESSALCRRHGALVLQFPADGPWRADGHGRHRRNPAPAT